MSEKRAHQHTSSSSSSSQASTKHRRLGESSVVIHSISQWLERIVNRNHEEQERNGLNDWLMKQRRFVVVQNALSQSREYNINLTPVSEAVRIIGNTNQALGEELSQQWRRLSRFMQRTLSTPESVCDTLTFRDLENHPTIQRIPPGDRGRLENELTTLFPTPLTVRKAKPAADFKTSPDPSPAVGRYATNILQQAKRHYDYLIQRRQRDRIRSGHQALITQAEQRCERERQIALDRAWDADTEDARTLAINMIRSIANELTEQCNQPDFDLSEFIQVESKKLLVEMKSANTIIKANRDTNTRLFHRLSALKSAHMQALNVVHLISQCMDACHSTSHAHPNAKQSIAAYQSMHSTMLSIAAKTDAEIKGIGNTVSEWLLTLKDNAIVIDVAHNLHDVLLKSAQDIEDGLALEVCRERLVQSMDKELQPADLVACGKYNEFRKSLKVTAKSVKTELDEDIQNITRLAVVEHESWDWTLSAPVATSSQMHMEFDSEWLNTKATAEDVLSLEAIVNAIHFTESDQRRFDEMGFAVEQELFKKPRVFQVTHTLAACLTICAQFMCKIAVHEH